MGYAAAATGPKDVMIVVDTSGSMSSSNRAGLARSATKAILDTLSWKDHASIVLFESNVHAVFSNTMVAVSEAQRAQMKTWADRMEWAQGGTNFVDAFFQNDDDGQGAFTIIANSVKAGNTSFCQKVIMFLTDGQSGFNDHYFQLVQNYAKRYDVTVFTYAIGAGADANVAKRLACENRGIFHRVDDGANLPTIM